MAYGIKTTHTDLRKSLFSAPAQSLRPKLRPKKIETDAQAERAMAQQEARIKRQKRLERIEKEEARNKAIEEAISGSDE